MRHDDREEGEDDIDYKDFNECTSGAKDDKDTNFVDMQLDQNDIRPGDSIS